HRRRWLMEGIEVRETTRGEDQDLPRATRNWTLHEAVAWLATQDDRAVQTVAQRIGEFERQGQHGWLNAWAELACSLKVSSEETDVLATINSVRERLRAACETGLVRASGIPANKGDRARIPPDDFVGAELWHGD